MTTKREWAQELANAALVFAGACLYVAGLLTVAQIALYWFTEGR